MFSAVGGPTRSKLWDPLEDDDFGDTMDRKSITSLAEMN